MESTKRVQGRAIVIRVMVHLCQSMSLIKGKIIVEKNHSLKIIPNSLERIFRGGGDLGEKPNQPKVIFNALI